MPGARTRPEPFDPSAFAQDILQAQAPSLSALSSRPKGMAEWGRVPPEEPAVKA